jgi:hypothetical protein
VNWEAVLWLTVIDSVEIVTFIVMVLLIRLAIRDRERELAAQDLTDAMPVPTAQAREEAKPVQSVA